MLVTADIRAFYRVWLGQIDYAAALRCGALIVEGPPALARQLPQWFMWSPMARFIRAGAPPLGGVSVPLAAEASAASASSR